MGYHPAPSPHHGQGYDGYAPGSTYAHSSSYAPPSAYGVPQGYPPRPANFHPPPVFPYSHPEGQPQPPPHFDFPELVQTCYTQISQSLPHQTLVVPSLPAAPPFSNVASTSTAPGKGRLEEYGARAVTPRTSAAPGTGGEVTDHIEGMAIIDEDAAKRN